MAKRKFIFNDESQTNSYRFKVATSGISLTRFMKNPVMLADHWNSTENVIGSWENTQKEGGILTGEPLFDSEDEFAKNIEGKVDRGFLKACSMGISYNRDDMEQQPDGSWLLKKCELFEVSICAVPSNANALRLYDASTKKLLSEEEVRMNLAFLENQTNPKIQMEKITLSIDALKALGLTTQPTTAIELDQQILSLWTRLVQEQKLHSETLGKLKEVNEAQAETLINEAVLSGKITVSEKESWKQMAIGNLSIASSALSKIPAKRNLADGITIPTHEGSDPKTMDEFEKLSLDQQLAFKKDNPEAYKGLWK